MKTSLIILIVFFVQSSLSQENLVPNHSFEDTVSCPLGSGSATLDFCANWFNPTMASPDYYNACNGGVPLNDWGYQEAQDGNAYAGFITYGGGNDYEGIPEYREYIEVKLSKPLEQNITYYWCMYVSLLDSGEYFSNNIGIALSSDSTVDFSIQFQLPLLDFSNWKTMISQASTWTKIGGTFIASGGEKYLLLGNFYSDSETSFEKWQTNIVGGPVAYYYVDNIYLGTDVCDIPKDEVIIPNIFTPNGDGINDYIDFSLFKFGNVTIINRWGSTVLTMDIQSNFLWYGQNYKNEDLTEGVYYYVINFVENNTLKQKTGSIHLVR